MFNSISDKTKRQAYLKALAESKEAVEETASVFNAKNKQQQAVPERVVLTGKDAVTAANKELKVQGSAQKQAIIGSKAADMKYYKDWRSRLAEYNKEGITLESLNKQPSPTNNSVTNSAERVDNSSLASQNAKPLTNNFGYNQPLKPITSGGEIGRERGLDGNDETLDNSRSQKDFLDNLLPNETKEETNSDDDFSFLDELFNARSKRTENLAQSNINVPSKSPLPQAFKPDYAKTTNTNNLVKQPAQAGQGATYLNENSINKNMQKPNTISGSEEKYVINNGASFVNRKAAFKSPTAPRQSIDSQLTNSDIDDDDNVTNEEVYVTRHVSNKPSYKKPSSSVLPGSLNTRKKKKKIDADIIGSTGFFTIR